MKIERNYPYNETIYKLFEEQAAKTPNDIAVVGQRARIGCQFIDTSSVGFKELTRKANQMAQVLRARGVTAGTIAAIMVKLGSLVNLVTWFGRWYRLGENTRVLQLTNYTFDLLVEQIFGDLLFSAKLYLVDKEWGADIKAPHRYIRKNHIHMINFLPIYWRILLGPGGKMVNRDTIWKATLP